MAINTTDVSVYHDDILSPDNNSDGLNVIDKNYLRILFRPGNSVQTRELNQVQTLLQNQIDSFGRGIYTNNTRIVGGEIAIDTSLFAYTVTSTDGALHEILNDADLSATDYDYTLAQSVSDGLVVAKIREIELLTDESGTRSYVVYGQYITTTPLVKEFTLNTTVSLIIDDNIVAAPPQYSMMCSNITKAVGATAASGVYYTKGSAVVLNPHTLYKAIDTSDYTGKLIIDVTESIVTPSTDNTLLDNAAGSPNYAGIGGDRYKILLSMRFVDSLADYNGDVDYIFVADLRDGVIINNSIPEDADTKNLADTLARRTYEQFGDFTIGKFGINALEYLTISPERRGFYSSWLNTPLYEGDPNLLESDVATACERKYMLSLSDSTAYVKGYRIKVPEVTHLGANKARTSYFDKYGANDFGSISAEGGQYLEGWFLNNGGIPNLSAALGDITVQLTEGSFGGTSIGTAKLINVERVLNPNTPSGSVSARFYLADITLNAGKRLKDIATIYTGATVVTPGALNIGIDVNTPTTIGGAQQPSSLFKLPYIATKSIASISATQKIRLVGNVGYPSGATPFVDLVLTENGAIDKSPLNIIAAFINTDDDPDTSSILADGEFSIDNTVYNDDAMKMRILLPNLTDAGMVEAVVSFNSSIVGNDVYGIKTLTEGSISWTPPNDGKGEFTLTDIHHLSHLTVDGFEIVHDGQTETGFIEAIIRPTAQFFDPEAGMDPQVPKLVTFKYWKVTTPGKFFTVDSYRYADSSIVDLKDIPSFDGTPLYNVIDIRKVPGNTRIALDPYSGITFTADYYLARKDRVVLNTSGVLSIVEGESAKTPGLPNIPSNSMALFNLTIPPYTFDVNDVFAKAIDTTKTTTDDVNTLRDRLDQIEDVIDEQIIIDEIDRTPVYNTDGTIRYTNGYLVDTFRKHAIGDTAYPGYNCSLDTARGLLYPSYEPEIVEFEIDPTQTDMVTSTINGAGYVVSAPWAETVWTQNNYATEHISVQPHEVPFYEGTVWLTPEVDSWKDTETRPAFKVDGDADERAAFYNANQNPVTMEFSDWSEPREVPGTSVNLPGWRREFTGESDRTRTETTRVWDETSINFGGFLSSVSLQPYMRSKAIRVKAQGFKPNTEHYAYFDGVPVKEFVHQVSDTSTPLIQSNSAQALAEAYPQTSLISDERGAFDAVFVIPNTDASRFTVGEKMFKLVDSINNNESEITSLGAARYVAQGMKTAQQDIIYTTGNERVTVAEFVENRSETVNVSTDPIAQTFIVESGGDGMFLTSIDLAFGAKPRGEDHAPVKCYLVKTLNGYPTGSIVPGSEVIIDRDEIIVSDDSSSITNFKFDYPIHVINKQEYALIVFSNSPSYRVYIAEKGFGKRDLITNEFVNQQTATGVFFTSANKSTWTAYQERDMKFSINRAIFTVGDYRARFKPVIKSDLDYVRVIDGGSGYTANVAITVAAPGVAGGITAEAFADRNIADGSIRGIVLTQKGLGYSSPPAITITDAGHGGEDAELQAAVNEIKFAAVNLIERVMVTSSETSVRNILTMSQQGISDQQISIVPNTPITHFPLDDYSAKHTNDGSSPFALNVTMNAIHESSPIINIEDLTLETRGFYLTTDEARTSAYYSKEVTLDNPGDRLDVSFDINRPSSSANVKLYVALKDVNGEQIGEEWNQFNAITPNLIPINSDPNAFARMTYTLDENTIIDDIGEDGIDFVRFRIKVVFLGEKITDACSISKLRLVATT